MLPCLFLLVCPAGSGPRWGEMVLLPADSLARLPENITGLGVAGFGVCLVCLGGPWPMGARMHPAKRHPQTQLLVAGLVLVMAWLVPGPSQGGEYPRITLSPPDEHWDCVLELYQIGSFFLYYAVWVDVVYSPSIPTRSVSFAIPEPQCLFADTVEVEYLENVTGHWRTGITVDFGDCRTERSLVMRLRFSGVVSEPNCAYRVVAHSASASGWTEFVDCEGQTRFAHGDVAVVDWDGSPEGTGFASSPPPPPSHPSPPDGATGVATTTTLDWDWSPAAGCPRVLSGDTYHAVYFGTEPQPALVDEWAGPYYDPGRLEPSTTYYWRVVTRSYSVPSSPVWSFTTADATPTEQTTWGAIKALYE